MQELSQLKKEYDALLKELQNPELISDWERFQSLSKHRVFLEKILKKTEEVEDLKTQLQENREMLGTEDQPELLSLAEEELKTLQQKLQKAEEELQKLLSKGDRGAPDALIMEIRAGTGGEEAALFAADLLSMYQKYAEKKGWETSLLQEDKTSIGGIKNASVEIKGEDAHENLQYEGGVHRVQRIPETEKAGRIHTSTVTVAVLPKQSKEKFQIQPQELKVEFTSSSGPGGQNVNKRQTAVRLTHIPTNLTVFIQTSRSQQRNKELALELLEAKLLSQQQEKAEKEVAGQRKAQVGWAKRVEKIRTYNFPQDRVTDHRIEKSWHGIEKIMQGELDPLVQALLEYQKSQS